MCGLSGVAGYLFSQEKLVVKDLLVLNVVRGVDSTGLCAIPRNEKDEFKLIRAIGTPYGDGGENPGLFAYKKFDTVIQVQSKALLGHNRAATKGAVSVTNAHPFVFEHVVGTHNGTLQWSSKDKLKNGKYYETDSEAIFDSINDVGFLETVKVLEGAWALVWYDRRDHTLNFCRNKERSLHYLFSDDEKCLFWSSDYSPLLYACHRQHISMGKNKPMLLPENTWLSWKIPETCEKFGEPLRTKAEGFTRPTYTPPSNFHGGKQNNGPWAERNNSSGYYGTEYVEYYDNSLDSIDSAMGNVPGTSGDPPKLVQVGQGFCATNDTGVSDNLLDYTTYSLKKKQNIIDAESCPVPQTANLDKLPGVTNLSNGVSNPHSTQSAKGRLLDKIVTSSRLRFQEMFPGLPEKTWIKKFEDPLHIVYYVPEKETWQLFHYTTKDSHWDHSIFPHAPICVPYRKINVESGGSHLFKYVGKREKKQIFYRGFRGEPLLEMQFAERVADGCINCQRVPVWGNEVRFFSPSTYLCEHCLIMPLTAKMIGELEGSDRKSLVN